jgi:transposase
MRGDEKRQESMFSYVSPEARVPSDHPLRGIRGMVDRALEELSPAFEGMYARVGRPSVPPEQLLRALLLQALYTVRSERLLMEELNYNLLFRWFVGLGMDDGVWDASTFSKNRDRLLEGQVAEAFFDAVVSQAREAGLLSDEHFTVDGTLIEAWAGQKSFKKKGSGPGGGGSGEDFHGERRLNETHESTTDPDARLYRKGKGKEAKLCYMGHVLMENRHGLAVGTRVTAATGKAEREAGLALMLEVPEGKRVTLGADKGYDVLEFIEQMRDLEVTPHIAVKEPTRRGGIDGRTTRHVGYEVSQKKRKLVEQIFGWMKTVGLLRKTHHRGRDRVGWMFTFTAAAYNLVRMRNLLAPT